ncbi:hypothetical protein [Kitasatospora sp. NPDC002965]|uniref:hypothetical protein n=1 Tax=Kitasatospora sp. NPDC002965 TaxID=3154775 RepID=UPI0033B55131
MIGAWPTPAGPAWDAAVRSVEEMVVQSRRRREAQQDRERPQQHVRRTASTSR